MKGVIYCPKCLGSGRRYDAEGRYKPCPVCRATPKSKLIYMPMGVKYRPSIMVIVLLIMAGSLLFLSGIYIGYLLR
jgi:hypothetical protein